MVPEKYYMKKNIRLKPFNQNGFTLIEMMMVIVIIAIVAALAVPKLGDTMARRDIDNAARQLAADLRWMQQLTVNSGGGAIPQMIFVPVEPYQYYVIVSSYSVKTVKLPTSVLVANPSVSFNINGLPVSPNILGTTITLYSTKVAGLSKQVIIDSMGRIRIN